MTPTKISQVTCPQCSGRFRLVWNDYGDMEPGDVPGSWDKCPKQTLILQGSPAYGVRIDCPHCDYVEEL